MSKKAKWILGAAALVALAAVLFFVWRGALPKASSIGIIGGADGPTAIYVSSRLSLSAVKTALWVAAAVIGGAIVGIQALRRRKKK